MSKIYLDGLYPCRANWCLFKKTADNKVSAYNSLEDEKYTLTMWEANYIKRLNGRQDPFDVPGYTKEECKELFKMFDECLFIRKEGRKIDMGFSKAFTLYIPSKKMSSSFVPKILNCILMLSFVPVFILGVVTYLNNFAFMSDHHFFVGYLGGILLGIVLHEFGHAIACRACKNGKVLEAGFLLYGIIPSAYVMVDKQHVRGRFKKVQINLAGIEVNLLLAGVCFFVASQEWFYLSSSLGEWSGALVHAAIQNVFLALFNLTFSNDLDGERAMSLLMGSDSIIQHAKSNFKKLIKPATRRRYFRENGVNSIVYLGTSFVIMCFQLVLPVLLLFDIIILIGGVF